MKRASLSVILLLLCMSFSPSVAQLIPAPNDTETDSGGKRTLSIDGYVTTKFASVGSDVELGALTRGHSSNTVVTADILYYEMDPNDFLVSTSPHGNGQYLDTIVLAQTGTHDDDANTMTWKGTYVIPVNSLGGVYSARVIAEDGDMRAVDDARQLQAVFINEFEKVLQAFDNAWDTSNPTLDIKSEFDVMDSWGTNNGGWSAFVDTATKGQGTGGSQQLWEDMLTAGHTQYDMAAGANFLEALMELLDSQDRSAAMAMVISLMVYANEFPIPRVYEDFGDVPEYLKTFDPIENFTRFAGTADFEEAYNAMLGSDEWLALEEALDNLANNVKPFESVQTIMHNIALLSVSVHPEAIAEGFMTWAQPLMEGDIESMTPFQRFVVRWVEMAEHLNDETDIHDTNGDDVPDKIMWQYEYLLETVEGQAWDAKMQSSISSSHVSDAFDDFNTLPEDVIQHIIDSIFSDITEGELQPVWDEMVSTVSEFGEWIEDAAFGERHMSWNPTYCDGEEDPDDEEECEEETEPVFHELDDNSIRTSIYDPNVLDVGVELSFWGPWDDEDYPSKFTMKMTNDDGDVFSTDLQQKENDRHRYLGRLTASNIEDTEWSFSQPMDGYEPDCADEGCKVEHAELRLEALLPSMLEAMAWESNDETFIASAVGVLVDQDETTSVNAPYTVRALSYDHEGGVEGAEVDIAIVRISPQQAEEAFAQFEPEGEVELTVTSNQVTGQYNGGDLDGDVGASIARFDDRRDDQEHPQAALIEEEIDISGMGSYWGVTSSELPDEGGLAYVVTSGTTDSGIEFVFTNSIPLPGTSGCARSEGHPDGSSAKIGWSYHNFRSYHDEGETTYDKPDLDNIFIDWGDGETWEHTNSPSDWREDGWESHDYNEEWWSSTDHQIIIKYTDEDSHTTEHYLTYKPHEGYKHDSDDGGESESSSSGSSSPSQEDEGDYREYKEIGWCDLHSEESFTPSAQIIDGFITDGPLEVMTEQILTTDANGEVSMTVTPTIPGVYITIVQTKVTRDDGKKMTGVGMNMVAVTVGSISLSGLTLETSLAGIPVYSVTPSSGGLTTISVSTSNIGAENYNAWLGIAPIDLSVPFPDISDDTWAEPEDWELEFEQGDSSRSQEVRIKAPISMIAVAVMVEGELFPRAVHGGILLNSPGALELTGALGPGQTTNIALSEDNEEASRILAMAAPEVGFDPASLDLSAFSELLYGEAVRPELGWISAEKSVERVCEESDVWHEHREEWNDQTQKSEYTNIRTRLEVHANEFSGVDTGEYDPSTSAVLIDDNGNTIEPTKDWYQEEWDDAGRWYAHFELDENDPDDEGISYTLISNTGYGLENEFIYYPNEDYTEDSWEDSCSDEEEMTEAEIFDLFDDFFGNLESAAWGIGSSADLHLPILSSPQDDYTIIAVAQIGAGASATVIPALGSKESIPNPEPPELQNLTLSFSPANPLPGDIVQITVLNPDNQPVSELSVTLVRDGYTLYGLVTDDNGQASFGVTVGTIVVRVSGGMYHPAELTIIVSEQGVLTADGETLPTDTDGDGVIDSEDEFPDDPNESEDTDGDGVGDNEDAFPDDPNESTDLDGDGVPDQSATSSESFITENWMLITGSSAALLIIFTTLVVVALMRRGRKDDVWSDDDYDDMNTLFDSTPAPVGPPPGMRGEMRDGYEVLEHPAGSSEWWWRDSSSGKWMEWR